MFDITHKGFCLNCKYWQVPVQFEDSLNNPVCRLGRGHTNPTDSCSKFSPKSTFDDIQNPEKYHDKPIFK